MNAQGPDWTAHTFGVLLCLLTAAGAAGVAALDDGPAPPPGIERYVPINPIEPTVAAPAPPAPAPQTRVPPRRVMNPVAATAAPPTAPPAPPKVSSSRPLTPATPRATTTTTPRRPPCRKADLRDTLSPLASGARPPTCSSP